MCITWASFSHSGPHLGQRERTKNQRTNTKDQKTQTSKQENQSQQCLEPERDSVDGS